MKNTQGGIVAVALLVVVGIALVTGGVFVYSKTMQNRSGDDLIKRAERASRANRPPRTAIEIYAELAWEKQRLQMETARLAELRAEASLALNSAFKDTYRTLSDATEKTDSLVKGNVNATTQARINKARAQIDEILKLWEFLANDTSGDNSAILTAIQNDLPAIQAYLNELTGIVGGLTAGNSGLTQAQITQLQSAVSSATQEVTTSTTVLVTAQTNVTGNTSSTPNQNTQTPVQQQQNVVNDIQDVIDDIENEIEETGVQPPTQPYNQIQAVTGATSNSSGYYGSSDTVIQSQSGQIIYPPNPAPVRRVPVQNGPSLIEGENDE